ncbi:MAG: DUF2062 domain-containing protein [Candidatus Omnitrophica bacterium]|nr:DUF2062 domain-containing protein [Candidatus Omnitrophota bacterium]MBU4303825.1 DUF2062 domain-containing protein [Candidatus Omnitrophota bacterium]MBU4418893.1 DUF2062 domain-containing protein [Candidatus Omnitrophota bacterium]MBU4468016.1 DUF2062 domain-containing protein [Candidatus Omnitrophota bacterium]MCG2707813.1 DUF2062 domain-containing protein [Candidatus Omnitrophota bacterium]
MKFKFKKILVKLLRQNNSPQEIALGAGIGAFISVLPVYGLHTVLVVLAAIIVRPANKIAIFLGTNLSLPPTIPFITWAAYEIGRYILKKGLPPLGWGFFKNLTFQKITSFYQPLFLGSLILGVVCAIVVYGLTFFVVKKIKERKSYARGSKNKEIRS